MSLPHCKYEGRFQLIHSTEQNPRMTMTTGCMWWTLKTGLASLDIFMVVGSVHMSKNKLFTHHGYHENLTSCGLILKLQSVINFAQNVFSFSGSTTKGPIEPIPVCDWQQS